MSAVLHNRHITCPHCKKDVEVIRSYGKGATYVTTWERVPRRVLDLLEVWVDTNAMRLNPLTKVEVYTYYNSSHNVKKSMSSFSIAARVSELLALSAITMTHIEKKSDSHTTSRAPRYTLNMAVALSILSIGGRNVQKEV